VIKSEIPLTSMFSPKLSMKLQSLLAPLGLGMNVDGTASEDDGRKPGELEITLDSSARLHRKKRVSKLFCKRRLDTHMSQSSVLQCTREHNAVSLRGFVTMSIPAESTSR
jgi:hypothetical protein